MIEYVFIPKKLGVFDGFTTACMIKEILYVSNNIINIYVVIVITLLNA